MFGRPLEILYLGALGVCWGWGILLCRGGSYLRENLNTEPPILFLKGAIGSSGVGSQQIPK